MTTHGHDSPDLAVEVLRCDGASDFVKKSFSDTGHTLERAILDNLDASGRSHPGAAKRSGAMKNKTPQPFEEGEMVFFDSRVELCGVRICGGLECGVKRRILDTLRHKNDQDRFVSYSGTELAEQVGCSQGQNGIASTVRDLRDHVHETMLAELNLRFDRRKDFIVNDRNHGYHFSCKITVHDAKEPAGKARTTIDDLLCNDADDLALNERQQWILEQLQTGVELRKSDLIARFGCSESTAARDLRALRFHGIIEFLGVSRSGYWRLASSSS